MPPSATLQDALLSPAMALDWLKGQTERLGAIAPAEAELPAVEAAVLAICNRHPASLDVLHRSGCLLARLRAYAPALLLFERALSIRPRFHYTELEMALAYAHTGRPNDARHRFERALRSKPDSITAYLHAARFEEQQKHTQTALLYLQCALTIDPRNASVVHEVVRIQTQTGRIVLAIETLRAALRNGAEDVNLHITLLRLLNQIGWYDELIARAAALSPNPGSQLAAVRNVEAGQATLARAYDPDRIVMRAALRERSARWIDVHAVAARLRAAITSATPTCLIRLGDGEGRFLAQADAALPFPLSADYRQAIRDVIWFNWFGQTPDALQSAHMDALVQQVRTTIQSADIIGIPDADRLATDRMHYGYLAYLDTLVDGVCQAREAVALTDAFVHSSLHEHDPFLRGLLVGVGWLGTISPHQSLGTRLRATLGIPDGEDHLIPGEMRLPNDPGLKRGRGHFPERFDALMAALTLPHRGAVVLVAGGLLGKIYCHRIRELGGIAIDIGSLADAWLGYTTRPGQYTKADQWRLPQ